MKINSISGNHYINQYYANKVGAPEKGKPACKPDQVTFSDEALLYTKSLNGIKDQIELHSAEEKARIADIKNLINRGQYRIDSEQVAERILNAYFR
jgi:flagellar biosynthesis anti-sigma factor FlgM